MTIVYARYASCAGQESAEALSRAGAGNPDCLSQEGLDCFAGTRPRGACHWERIRATR